MSDVVRAAEVALRVARTGLSEANEPIRVPADAWLGALDVISHQRLTGLAVESARRGLLELSGSQEEELLARHREAMVHALALERRLLALHAAFRDEDIDLVVLKGPAVAHTYYTDPSLRPFGDLDLLVRTRDWARAYALLAEAGFRRRFPEPRPAFVERFGHTAVHADAEGVELDLHRTLIGGAFGQWVDEEELWSGTSSFRIAGRTIRRLDDTTSLLHACIHASLGSRPPLLIPLRDVIEVSGSGAVDWGYLARRAERWKLRAVLQHAFRSAQVLGVGPPPEAKQLADARMRRVERRALASYTSRRSRGGKAMGTLRAIPGVRRKVAYVWALLVPSRRFLESRAVDGRRASYLKRWTIPVRWLARRGGEPRRP